MRLKVFRAATMTAAMAQVRSELGAEALILSTCRVAGGVELTAGIEPETTPAEPICRALATDREACLAWHGVPAPLSRKLQAGPLPFALSVALRFGALNLASDSEPLLLVGPPGAGKTLTVARLATRLVLAGTIPLVITADAARAGSAEQLAAFTRLLGIELLAARQPETVARALSLRQDGAPVLIDTHGAGPFDPAERRVVGALARAAGAALVVVLPAGLDSQEAAEMAAAYAAEGARLMVATRLDLARRLGSVLAAAHAGLGLAEFGVGPGVADGLMPATPADLARRLEAVSRPGGGLA